MKTQRSRRLKSAPPIPAVPFRLVEVRNDDGHFSGLEPRWNPSRVSPAQSLDARSSLTQEAAHA